MCGIIAVLRRRSDRLPPTGAHLVSSLQRGWSALDVPGPRLLDGLVQAAGEMEAVDAALRGAPGVQALLAEAGLADDLTNRVEAWWERLGWLERDLDAGSAGVDAAQLEHVNAAVLRLKDAVWAVRADRLRTAREVGALAGDGAAPSAIEGYLAIQVALSAIDRLEVRGRDSAGLHVLVAGHGLDADNRGNPLFTSGSVRHRDGCLGFVYKAAAEIGELGDNTAALRAAIGGDELLRRALSSETAEVTVLGHTRWASVGVISEPNAHPLNSEEEGADAGPYLVAALNGDVDNYAELRSAEDLRIAPEITTDAKVIPTLVSRRRAGGAELGEAFRSTVATFDGSVAIAASASESSDRLLLALRGSGQALYVGLAEDAFIVASEPYGLVEETPLYLRMDGESESGRDGSAGQVIVLDRAHAGSADGITRLAYDGTELPVGTDDLTVAEITTRDIDRAGAPHFLLKEITEAPLSVRKTLRGKLVEIDGRPAVALPDSTLPASIRSRLADGSIKRVAIIGQGTAAVAGQSVAAALSYAAAGSPLRVDALPATELSGFGLVDDMSDTLIVAISQSGTTTDTNRTVDLVRSRGAAVVAIVNRRNSDLVEKADGVLYTSDGRDVEMAVPSTKAFYGQVAAGLLLAWAIADAMGVADPRQSAEVLAALGRLPDAMEVVLGRREEIALAASQYGPPRRYWAVVGNGPNRVAAQELRIKLSELCYKSISFDSTEDKKHIDLSAEPLILVCAAGLDGSNADDVAKEVAIFRAHKAAPLVIANDGEERFSAALQVLPVPAVHPSLDFVLSAMAGHLFGYEAALAIDAQARLLREARGVVEDVIASTREAEHVLGELRHRLEPAASRFFEQLRSGALNGHLEASTAVRLASLFRYALGMVPLESYDIEYGKLGSPAAVVDDLTAALTSGIEELTRPIDAIKHQAKTVTVGISRSEDVFVQVPLVREALSAGSGRDRIGYRALRTLAALDAAVAEVAGFTRYAIDGGVADDSATVTVVDKGGVAVDIPSRTPGPLRGTKRRAATEREVTVARGYDGRTVIHVPEVKDNQVVGITLLHARFHERLAADDMRAVLSGYRGRYDAVVDAVTESEPTFRDEVLAEVPVIDLLVEPVHVLAAHWRTAR